MRFALLLYADAAVAAATTESEADDELARYGSIAQELADEGVLRGGEAFLPASDATRVHADDETVTAEAVEAGEVGSRELSGFLLVECDRDRAVEIAGSLPVASHGHVEVRPLRDLPPPT